MAQFKILNNVEHADLRVLTERSAALGDDVMYAATFPSEFRQVQRHYPICFLRHPETREVMSVALFGVEDGENLFLGDEGWEAAYVPLNVRRLPLLVAFQQQEEFGQSVREPVVSIDMDSPRISRDRGEALFLEHGGNSEYLEHMSSMLKALHEGNRHAGPFYQALDELGLLESFVLEVEIGGQAYRMSGFLTINEEVLAKLDTEQIGQLHGRGYLEAIYMVLASMAHLPELLERKKQRIEAASAHA